MTDHSFQIVRTCVEQQLANLVDSIIEATMHEPANAALLREWRQTFDLDSAVDYSRLPGVHITTTTQQEPAASARDDLEQLA